MSPTDKNGSDVEFDGMTRASAAGDAVTFISYSNFAGGGDGGSLNNQLFGSRTASGWHVKGINPPQDPFPGIAIAEGYEAFSQDLSKAAAYSRWFLGVDGAPEMPNLFLVDTASSTFELLSRPFAPITPESVVQINTNFGGASDDFQRIVFGSYRALTVDAPPDLGGQQDGYLYEWFDHGIRLISILPDGTPVVGRVVVGSGMPGPPTSFKYPGDHAVSADGSRVFFTVSPPLSPEDLYVRIDDGAGPPSTVLVSQSERTAPDPAGHRPAVFRAADAAGSSAFFVSDEKMTDDATASAGSASLSCADGGACPDLYRWRAAGAPGHHLTDLTTGDSQGGGVLGVVGSAEDGSRVYFAATGALAAGAVEGHPNLYMWDATTGLRLVAQLDGTSAGPSPNDFADAAIWSSELSNGDGPRFRDARVKADGQRILFRSRASLTAYDTAGHFQLYLYDAAADDLTCVSCNSRTQVSTGDAWLKRKTPGTNIPPWFPKNLSADGRRVLFDTVEPLVAEDTNGKIDVYEWNSGSVQLISGGQDASDSAFVDASSSGDDVFFTTRMKLSCQDTDELTDLYDARIGGGFGDCAATPKCSGDSCQGPLPASPSLPKPDTTTFAGAGNERAAAPKRKKASCRKRGGKKVARKGRCAKSKHRARAKHRKQPPSRKAGR